MCNVGLLPGGISSLTALLSESADNELLPPACAWVLLLALHLLCELRDPHCRQAFSALSTMGTCTHTSPQNHAPTLECSFHARTEHGLCKSRSLTSCKFAMAPKGVLRKLHGCRWAGYVRLLPAPPGSLVAAVCSDGPPASDLLLFRQASQNLILNGNLLWQSCLYGPSHPPVPYTTMLQSCSAC